MSIRNRYRRYISTRTVGSQGRTVRSLSVRRAVEYEACRSVCVSSRGLSVRVAVRCQRRGRRRIGTTGYRGRIAGVTARCLIVRSVCKSARSLVNQFRTPSVLVYPQPAAPVPTLVLGVERHAPRLVAYRPARYRKGI
jgi:hypothetical protein